MFLSLKLFTISSFLSFLIFEQFFVFLPNIVFVFVSNTTKEAHQALYDNSISGKNTMHNANFFRNCLFKNRQEILIKILNNGISNKLPLVSRIRIDIRITYILKVKIQLNIEDKTVMYIMCWQCYENKKIMVLGRILNYFLVPLRYERVEDTGRVNSKL